MAEETIKIRASDVMSGVTIRVKLVGVGVSRLRLRAAIKLVKLAGFVSGCKLEVDASGAFVSHHHGVHGDE